MRRNRSDPVHPSMTPQDSFTDGEIIVALAVMALALMGAVNTVTSFTHSIKRLIDFVDRRRAH